MFNFLKKKNQKPPVNQITLEHIEPEGYYPSAFLMFHACFQILVHFVEVRKGLESKVWDAHDEIGRTIQHQHWEWLEGHLKKDAELKYIKREIDDLYKWYLNRVSSDFIGPALPSRLDQLDQTALQRLINIRKYLNG